MRSDAMPAPGSKPEQRKQVLELLRDPLTRNFGPTKIARLAGVTESTVRRHGKNVASDGPIYHKGTIEILDVADLRLDEDIQSRAEMNPEAIGEYVEAIRGKAAFPPIGVVFDGTTYWVWDGFHRVKAHVKARRRSVLAEVRQGTRRDAVLLSARANAEHGMRRTNADKRRAVETLLRDPEWSLWSDREIGRRAAVSPMMVASVRANLTERVLQSTVRRGADGRAINTANIGRTSNPQEAPMPHVETEVSSEPGSQETPPPAPANGRYHEQVEMPRIVSEPLGVIPEVVPLDPPAAVRLLVRHFKGEALDALIRGLASWRGFTLTETPE